MDFLEILRLISGPLIGAVIGLFTNWMAVKMLFRPRKALYIGKMHIPFTPGVIPRRQGALAKALGRMVSESLVRKEDLKASLCSDAVSHTVARSIMSLPSIASVGDQMLGEKYEVYRDKTMDLLADKIIGGILSMDLGAIITREANETVSTFAGANPLIKMFVSDQLIATLTAPIAGKVEEYLKADGREKLRERLAEEYGNVENKSVAELISNEEKFESILVSFYHAMVNKYADPVVDHFRIDEIVEEKIRAMDSRDLEALLLTIMKKELNALIWLGIPIGFVMGCITTLINHI